MVGTAEQSRLKVRNYFHELRETLNRQEIVALTTVDNHIREKLCMLRQQQEDMTILLSQISAVCHQCESTLQSVCIQGLEVIKLEFILKLIIKHNDWLLADMCPQATNHCTLF